MSLDRLGLTVAILLTLPSLAIAQDVPRARRCEAEDVSQPKSAWIANEDTEDHWNLWSTDVDADRKWSGGVVLRSPAVMEDRASGEEGAPVLHTVVDDLPPGRYAVEIGLGRVLGISFDGESWQRQSSSQLGEFDLPDGRFEIWVDDRYALEGESRGSAYYDYLLFTPVLEAQNGVRNGGFEQAVEGTIGGWSWWTRENDAGSAQITDEVAHSGRHSCYIEHLRQRDFALRNTGRLDVEFGDLITASAWVRVEEADRLDLVIVGLRDGQVVRWNVASRTITQPTDWTLVEAGGRVLRGIDEVYVRFTGTGNVRAWVDDVSLQTGIARTSRRDRPPVDGWADEAVVEHLDRGLVAVPMGDGRIYLSWRLLRDDPKDVGFEVYRRAGDAGLEKLTARPITETCDFIDENPVPGVPNRYAVRAVGVGFRGEISRPASADPNGAKVGYVAIPLQKEYEFQKTGIADLNGDGALDFVIKQPNDNVDPYVNYWYASPDTYKLEAYLSDGTFLWRRDLGWNIERGIWYSPYIVWDLNGDGRAEVAVKTAPMDEDYRDETGRVTAGPEWLSILDGMTGEELARVDWPAREDFPSYNYASRNQMCIAYLDGRTPCVVINRGTYNVMKVVAYQFHDGRLQRLWSWEDTDEGGQYRGQGAHSMHAVDVDGDGRDEVFLGSSVLDDNGVGLWSSGMGHPDHHYVGDIDPTHPGLEVYYGMETRAGADGMWLADADTGEWLWGCDEPTTHIHASGMCADIDPRYPGMECYSGERDFPEKRWLWSAQGDLIAMTDLGGLSPRTVYWDADPQRELVRGSRTVSFRGETHTEGIEGRLVLFGDIVGDWREELIATLPGELRIYTTTIPATDRRVCLLQDHLYRMDVAIQAMGYTQPPMTSTCLSAGEPNMTIMVPADGLPIGEKVMAELVLTAPASRPLEGVAMIEADPKVALGKTQFDVNLPPGEIGRYEFGVTLTGEWSLLGESAAMITARLNSSDGPLSARTEVRPRGAIVRDRPRTQAEDFADQGGGEVQIRDDKVASDALSISHWDEIGHWLQWRITAPETGRYALVVRYCAQFDTATRAAAIDGEQLGEFSFPSTGGFSSERNDWAHGALRAPDGEPITVRLEAGEHIVRMENRDGRGMNLDYLMLVPVD